MDDLSRGPPASDHNFGRDGCRTHYDDDGHFLGAIVVDPAESGRYQAARDAAWDAAEPFEAWWARHPEYHRAV
ncbi:MAG: DUF6879 family protein [Pseudonocardiaceae bacterium]